MPVNDFNLSCCGRGFDSLRLHHFADVTQLVEYHVANVNVVGSNPIIRSIFKRIECLIYYFC